MDPVRLLNESQLHGMKRLADRRFRIPWTVALILVMYAAVTSLHTAIVRYQNNPTFVTRVERYRTSMLFPTVCVSPELEFANNKMEEFLDEVQIAYVSAAALIDSLCLPRIPWAVALILVLWAATTSLHTAIIRYQTNPTYLTRSERYRTTMLFPAVLICPELDFPPHKMQEFLGEVEYPADLNRTYLLSVLRQLAAFYSPDVKYSIQDLENIERLIEYNRMDLQTVALKLNPTCEEAIFRCRWRGTTENCLSLFRMEIMTFGFCCVFNGRSLKRASVKQDPKVPEQTKSESTRRIGYRNGLMLVVNQTTSIQMRDMDLSYKWLIVTEPFRFVEGLSLNGTPLSPGQEIWLDHHMKTFDISDSARNLGHDLRRCQLSTEKTLKLFPIYKRGYCRVECEMAKARKYCNCTLPTHPTESAEYCKARNLSCAREVSRHTTKINCKCLQACDSLIDWYETTYYDLSTRPATAPFDDIYDGLDFDTVTVIRIHVGKREMYEFSRESYFTALDLFSQLGGIFNVFFGLSVLSIFEIMQLLIHLFLKFRRRKQRKTEEVKKGLKDQDKKPTKLGEVKKKQKSKPSEKKVKRIIKY